MMGAMSFNTTKILILDANQRSALASTRSLGQLSGVEIWCADNSISALAGSSRYCRNYYQCPCPQTSAIAFLDWIETLVTQQGIDFVFPMTEISSQLLLMNRERLGNSQLPFADYNTVMTLADKGKLTQLATKLGIPHPDTQYYASASEFTIASITGYPTVIKPNMSRIWTGEHWIDTTVKIADTAEQLQSDLQANYLQDYPFMQQAFIPGHGAGVFALYNQGEAITFFAHQRLREKPPRGGVSVLSRSVTLDDELLNITKKLLDGVNWHGVAMVEFRIDPQGRPYLMEVNTRFWGSLQLAIDSGVDFPKLLCQICLGQNPQPATDYNSNQRLRWLLGDVDSLYIYLKDSGFSLKEKLARIGQFLTPQANTRHEVNRLGDLKPAWFELKKYLRELF